jgi:hypothetical protein
MRAQSAGWDMPQSQNPPGFQIGPLEYRNQIKKWQKRIKKVVQMASDFLLRKENFNAKKRRKQQSPGPHVWP